MHPFAVLDKSLRAMLVARYMASLKLPRRDSHRLADDSFQDTPASSYPALTDKYCDITLSRIQDHVSDFVGNLFNCKISGVARNFVSK